MMPQIGPLAASGHGPIRTCATPDAVSQVPMTDGACAEAGDGEQRRAAPPEKAFSLFLPDVGSCPGQSRPGHRPPVGDRSPAVRSSARRSSAATTPSRRFGRTLHVRHQILHDAGAGMQLPVGELLQDDRAQQFVVGRRHRHGRRRAQPRREIGQRDRPVRRRQRRRSAAGSRAARASDCRDGTAPAPARARRLRSRCAGEAAARSDRSATLLPSRSAAVDRRRRLPAPPRCGRDGSCRCPAGRSAPAPAPASRASDRSRPAPRDCRPTTTKSSRA